MLDTMKQLGRNASNDVAAAQIRLAKFRSVFPLNVPATCSGATTSFPPDIHKETTR